MIAEHVRKLNIKRKHARKQSLNDGIHTFKIKKEYLKDENGDHYGNRVIPRDRFPNLYNVLPGRQVEAPSRKRQIVTDDIVDVDKVRKAPKRNRTVNKPRPRVSTVTERPEGEENQNSRIITSKEPEQVEIAFSRTVSNSDLVYDVVDGNVVVTSEQPVTVNRRMRFKPNGDRLIHVGAPSTVASTDTIERVNVVMENVPDDVAEIRAYQPASPKKGNQ